MNAINVRERHMLQAFMHLHATFISSTIIVLAQDGNVKQSWPAENKFSLCVMQIVFLDDSALMKRRSKQTPMKNDICCLGSQMKRNRKTKICVAAIKIKVPFFITISFIGAAKYL